jgi:hypothetical protein
MDDKQLRALIAGMICAALAQSATFESDSHDLVTDSVMLTDDLLEMLNGGRDEA